MTVDPDMRVLAVIPARGGSKGIPRKNLLRIEGQTLVARTVAAARGSRHRLQVLVSTDDPEIAAEAAALGVPVVIRPPELATDAASSESALIHALDIFESEGNPTPDVLLLLQCTSPLTEASDIDGTIDALVQEGADCSFSAVASHLFLWRNAEGGGVVGLNHDFKHRPRRQDRDPDYVETGAVYAMRVPGFLQHQHRFFGKVAAHATPAWRWLEIDEPEDVKLAEARLTAFAKAASCLSGLKAVVFDFDGVMTDDRVTVDSEGVESVTCSRSDGFGVERLRNAGLKVAVLSRESNPVVRRRCEKLQVPCAQGVGDKERILREWAESEAIPLAEIAFVGNDLPDLRCIQMVGLGVAVADAHPEVRAHAKLVLQRRGGFGAVREICDLVVDSLDQRAGGR